MDKMKLPPCQRCGYHYEQTHFCPESPDNINTVAIAIFSALCAQSTLGSEKLMAIDAERAIAAAKVYLKTFVETEMGHEK